jgi:hypothetical protein
VKELQQTYRAPRAVLLAQQQHHPHHCQEDEEEAEAVTEAAETPTEEEVTRSLEAPDQQQHMKTVGVLAKHINKTFLTHKTSHLSANLSRSFPSFSQPICQNRFTMKTWVHE